MNFRAAPRRSRVSIVSSVRGAAVPFVVTRAIVLASLGVAYLSAHQLGFVHGARAAGTSKAGLLAWDAAIYERIAAVGYAPAGPEAVRFFPLYPIVARGVAWLPGISTGTAMIIVANFFGFAALVALHALVTSESIGRRAPSHAVWAMSLWPAAFVLVMGYAESLFIFLSILAFFAWRKGYWWLSIVPACLAGLCRPTGLLLAVPALVQAVVSWRDERSLLRGALGRVAAVAAAPAGAAIYLYWARRFGPFLTPIRDQLSGAHRGSVSDPFVTMVHDGRDLLGGHHLGTAMHAPFAIAFVLLTVYLFFRLPAAYCWYAAVTVGVALTASNLDSLERYGLACFPLAIGVGLLIEHRRTRWIVLPAMGALLAALATLAFLGKYVP